jgi:hypothetical protein
MDSHSLCRNTSGACATTLHAFLLSLGFDDETLTAALAQLLRRNQIGAV